MTDQPDPVGAALIEAAEESCRRPRPLNAVHPAHGLTVAYWPKSEDSE